MSNETPPIDVMLYEWELALQFPGDAGLPALEHPRITFAVDSDEKLAWLVAKLRERERQIADIQEQAARMTKKLVADRDALVARFGEEARLYLTERLKRERGRSIDLLTGRTGLRKLAGGFKVVDDNKAMAWAKENLPQAVMAVVIESVDKAMLKDHMKRTGEVIPGGDHEEPRDKWYVEGVSL